MKMRYFRNLTFIIVLLCLVINQAHARQPLRSAKKRRMTTPKGRVIEVNEEYNFVVINLGSADDVKENMVFSVFQKEEEVAKIKAIKMRKLISACYIQILFVV